MATKRSSREGKTVLHSLALHQGEALLRFAKTYPTITLTIVEAVQNAIDADATKIFIGIDVQQRIVCVLDDGTGVTEEKFQEALRSVGKTIKPQKGKKVLNLGRFGLGLISPLDKCAHYVFASHPADSQQANIWVLEGAKIQPQHEVKIPFEQKSTLPPIPGQFVVTAGQLFTRWRTVVYLTDVTEDKVVGVADMDELESQIRYKLGPTMQAKGTTAHVVLIDEHGETQERSIDPTDFTGEPLEVVTFTQPACGEVTFELYRAKRTTGVRKGQVVVTQTGDITRILWQEFRTQAMGWRKLSHVQAAFDVLGSGYFEGVIHAENIELAADRKTFALGDALRDLYVAIYAWYLEHGKALYEDEQESRREQRYQELGQKSLQRIMDLLNKDQTFAAMARKLAEILPSGGEQPGARPSAPKPRPPGTAKEKPAAPSEGKRRIPPSTHPGLPFRYAHEMLASSTKLWEFDLETATLTFNVRHPTWEMLEKTDGKPTSKNDQQLLHLQEWLTLKLLLLLSRHDEPDFSFEVARLTVDEEVKYYAKMFIASPEKKGKSDSDE